MSYSGLEEFQQPEFEGYGPKPSKSVSEDTSNEMEFVRPKQQEKPVRKPVKYAEMYRPKAVNTTRPNSAVVNVVRANQTLRNLMKDMLPLGEEPNEGKLLVKELLKLMCDKKNNVLFTDTGCFVLSLDFKLADESQGKQHKASCKSKIQNSITQPLFKLHMDLFGPTFVSSLMNKKYCLVVTDDYSRFTCVFFLASKDETSGILKRFITEIENLVEKKVKIIRCDNGT
ncbi:putative ribonuclease H-like domain-containing protein [Tanacetum coccineum]